MKTTRIALAAVALVTYIAIAAISATTYVYAAHLVHQEDDLFQDSHVLPPIQDFQQPEVRQLMSWQVGAQANRISIYTVVTVVNIDSSDQSISVRFVLGESSSETTGVTLSPYESVVFRSTRLMELGSSSTGGVLEGFVIITHEGHTRALQVCAAHIACAYYFDWFYDNMGAVRAIGIGDWAVRAEQIHNLNDLAALQGEVLGGRGGVGITVDIEYIDPIVTTGG